MGLRRSGGQERLREVVEREFPRDPAGLIGQLGGSDPEQRRWAARDLAGVPQAAAALGARLVQERDASVRDVLFTSLATIANEAAVEALLPLLRSEDAGLRNEAIETLARMPQAVGPRINALLADPDVDARIFAVNLLGELSHPNVPTWLSKVLGAERDVNVVGAAIEVLAEVGEPAHLPLLQKTRERFAEDAFIGFAVAMAIERIQAS